MKHEVITIGMFAERVNVVGAQDIQAFAAVSGDANPVHLDAAYAEKTMFKGCIAHGMLSASFISAALGTQLPGEGAIYLEQNLRFKAPVRPGDTVTTRVEVVEVMQEKKRIRVATTCRVGDVIVLDGEAKLWVPHLSAQ